MVHMKLLGKGLKSGKKKEEYGIEY